MDRPTDGQFAAWYPRLLRTALRMTGDVHQAADLTQQAFYQALSRWDQFDGQSLRTTWLFRILLNCVRDWARQEDVRAADRIADWGLVPAAETQTDDCPPEHREKLAYLRQTIQNLSSSVRPAFVTTVLDGCTYLEASELLDVPVGTIASRVHEARTHINAAMRERFPEG